MNGSVSKPVIGINESYVATKLRRMKNQRAKRRISKGVVGENKESNLCGGVAFWKEMNESGHGLSGDQDVKYQ
jgi:hypothetical protein